jgi:hypothetical protein
MARRIARELGQLSYRIARRLIYGDWPHQPGPLPASYETAALPVVNVQLERAGVRLAAVLSGAPPK